MVGFVIVILQVVQYPFFTYKFDAEPSMGL